MCEKGTVCDIHRKMKCIECIVNIVSTSIDYACECEIDKVCENVNVCMYVSVCERECV